LSLNYTFLLNVLQVRLYNPPFTVIMNGIFANYLRTMYWSVFGLKECVQIHILNCVIFPAKVEISKPIDVPYIHVYCWFKNDKRVFQMWIWLKNISLLDRICSCDSFASLTRQQLSCSGSTGWYFRYQSIHIQIAYISEFSPDISLRADIAVALPVFRHGQNWH
jgi:hypothetical protein